MNLMLSFWALCGSCTHSGLTVRNMEKTERMVIGTLQRPEKIFQGVDVSVNEEVLKVV